MGCSKPHRHAAASIADARQRRTTNDPNDPNE
jgi:hypothetical protein